MIRIVTLALAAICVSGPALAADFGRVRWPDWMDGYILLAAASVGFGLLMVFLTKPSGLSIGEARTARIGVVPRIFFVVLQLSFFGMMGLIFYGMYLARAGG